MPRGGITAAPRSKALPAGTPCAALGELVPAPALCQHAGMQEIPNVLGFTSGELSPWLANRFDLQAYQRGAARLCNFIVTPYGGLRRRRGTEAVQALTADEAAGVRLFSFVYEQSDALMLEFTPGRMRVYRDGQLVTGEAGTPYTLSTPWTAAELAALRFTQINDVVYACCPTHPPVRLERYGDADWRCTEPELQPAPRAQYVKQSCDLQVDVQSGSSVVNLTLPSGADMAFTADMVGRQYLMADAEMPSKTLFRGQSCSVPATACPDLSSEYVGVGSAFYTTDSATSWKVFYRCVRAYEPENFNGSQDPADYPHYFMPGYMRLEDGTPYEVNSDWELYTKGEWNMAWEIWRSYDSLDTEPNYFLWDWERLKSFDQSSYTTRQNWALSGSETRPCRFALVWKSGSSTSASAFCHLNLLGGKREYKMLITAVKDARHATAKLVHGYLDNRVSFSTRSWSFAAMGPLHGYPAFSSFFQGRLWFGGIPGLPTTLLASCVDDYHDFFVGSADSDALHLTLASDDRSRITWMCPGRQLLLGTTESEWVLSSGEGRSITASTAAFTRQSSVGSESLPARGVENTVLFVQRGGKRLREISYKLEADGFTAVDLSLLAEHLPASGIRDYAVQRGAQFYIWVLMNDGSLAVLTLNPEQQVTAWQRVELPGRRAEQLCTIPSADGGDDEVWFLTRNRTNGAAQLERLTDTTPFEDLVCESSAPNTDTFPALAGCTVHLVHTDGTELTAEADENGVLNLSDTLAAGTWSLGVPYESALETLPTESVASYNSVRQMSRVRLRLLESALDFRYKSTVTGRWETYQPVSGLQDAPYTGSIRLSQMPDAGVGQGFSLICDGNADFRLLALTIEVDHHGK